MGEVADQPPAELGLAVCHEVPISPHTVCFVRADLPSSQRSAATENIGMRSRLGIRFTANSSSRRRARSAS